MEPQQTPPQTISPNQIPPPLAPPLIPAHQALPALLQEQIRLAQIPLLQKNLTAIHLDLRIQLQPQSLPQEDKRHQLPLTI